MAVLSNIIQHGCLLDIRMVVYFYILKSNLELKANLSCVTGHQLKDPNTQLKNKGHTLCWHVSFA